MGWLLNDLVRRCRISLRLFYGKGGFGLFITNPGFACSRHDLVFNFFVLSHKLHDLLVFANGFCRYFRDHFDCCAADLFVWLV
jgi:hypothetical protein